MDKKDLVRYVEGMFIRYRNEDRFGFTISFDYINFNEVNILDIQNICDNYKLILTYFPKDQYMMFEYMCPYYYDKRKKNKEASIL